MGRFVVTTAIKVSLVPHAAATCPPLTGSWRNISQVLWWRIRHSDFEP